MNNPANSNEVNKPSGNLRNFDLTVDEIRLQRTIDSMINMVKQIEALDPQSERVRTIHQNIKSLQSKLEDLRDNTLIR